MLSDWKADFVTELGQTWDGSKAGLGTRAKRFALYADDGTIKHVGMEATNGECTISSADGFLEEIKDKV